MRNLLIAAAAIAVAVALFVALRPKDDNEPTASPPTTTGGATTNGNSVTAPVVPQPPQPPPPQPTVVEITIENGAPAGGVRRVTVAKGRRVALVVMSDVADHVHLHGYDLTKDLVPGRPSTLAFRATIVGTVEAELEERGVQIASITTKP